MHGCSLSRKHAKRQLVVFKQSPGAGLEVEGGHARRAIIEIMRLADMIRVFGVLLRDKGSTSRSSLEMEVE
jgi:hypothetical protein